MPHTDTRAAASGVTVSIAFVRSAVRALDEASRSLVLTRVSIASDLLNQAEARVPASAFAALWMAVARTLDDEFFGLDRRRMKVGSFAMLCRSVAGLPTVGAALRAALAGFSLFLDDIGASLRLAGGQALLVVDNRIAPDQPDARRFADETLLVLLLGLLCGLAGRRVQPVRLDWAHPRPAHADEYTRMFAPLIRFDAPATALVFDAAVLGSKSALDEPALAAFLRDAPQSVFLKQVSASALSDRARRTCRAALQAGEPLPTLEALAAQWAMAPATLRRRLAAEGAGWQALKDGVRRELALAWLAEAGRAPASATAGVLAAPSAARATVAEVAARLGFEDASTFYRAFRKWTGLAPAAWRQGSGQGSGQGGPVATTAMATTTAAVDSPARPSPPP